METKEDIAPAWFRKETPIEVRDDISISAFSSDGEFGIMPGSGEADIEVKAEEASFLFGKSKDDLLFMPRFGLFFKVYFNSDEESVAARLYDQPVGVYRSLSLTKDERFTVPVYHDALSMIPLESLDESPAKDKDTHSLLLNMPDPFRKDDEEEIEVEKQVDKFVAQTQPFDDEIQAAVDAEIEKHGGCVYSRYRPGNNRLYSYDLAKIGKRFFIVVYADFAGDWLADEDSFTGEPPLWFSEKDHRVSPIFQAKKCCSFFMHELPMIKIEALVILPKRCVVINDDDMRDCWNKKCNTTVVRTKKIDETTLETLHEYLASQPTDDGEVPELDTVEIAGMSSRFAVNPDNWINKD